MSEPDNKFCYSHNNGAYLSPLMNTIFLDQHYLILAVKIQANMRLLNIGCHLPKKLFEIGKL